MTTQSACLEVISQNISNVNTTGYKKADMEFATLLTDEKASADIFAVQPWQRQSVDRAGPTQSTGRWSDLAISGPGMFVLNSKVDGSGDMVFTRNGGFGTKALDANGDGTSETYLVDSHGNYLQGWKANADGQLSPTNSTASLSSVYYEPGQDIPGQATKTVTIQANVDSNSNKTEKLSVPIYDQSLKTQSMTMSWDRTGENAWNLKLLATEGTITNLPDGVPVQFDGTAQVVSPKTFDATIAWKDGTSSTVTINLSNTTQ
ncbi:MAG: flagellar hook-basal body complex protein, partial [Rhodospirillales bacterium]|nr:flagellar hook-basal body complex protein [Rhodospirillales bacterium]